MFLTEYRVHKLMVDLEKHNGVYWIENRKHKEVFSLRIPYTAFSLQEITLVEMHGAVMLPDEYKYYRLRLEF